MDLLSIITTVSGIVMSFGYWPQTYKIMKRRSSADVSLLTYMIFAPGTAVWLAYGLSKADFPLVICNTIALFGAFSVLAAYFAYRKKKRSR